MSGDAIEELNDAIDMQNKERIVENMPLPRWCHGSKSNGSWLENTREDGPEIRSAKDKDKYLLPNFCDNPAYVQISADGVAFLNAAACKSRLSKAETAATQRQAKALQQAVEKDHFGEILFGDGWSVHVNQDVKRKLQIAGAAERLTIVDETSRNLGFSWNAKFGEAELAEISDPDQFPLLVRSDVPGSEQALSQRHPTTDASTDDLPCVGCRGHPEYCGQPCKFFWKERGCKDGKACTHCHICRWRPSVDRAMKKRSNGKPIRFSL